MKKLISLFVIPFFLLAADVSATALTDTLPAFDSADGLRYKVMSKKQATTGIVLTAGGLVMGVVAYSLAMSSLSFPYNPDKDYGDLPAILGYGALALATAGVAFLISSKRNKRKANIILSDRNLSFPQTVTGIKRQMSAGIVIDF